MIKWSTKGSNNYFENRRGHKDQFIDDDDDDGYNIMGPFLYDEMI